MAAHFIYILLYIFLFPADSVAVLRDSVAVSRDSVLVVRDSVPVVRDSVLVVRDSVPVAADSVSVPTVPFPVEEYLNRADYLRKAYEFRKAVSICKEVLPRLGPDDSLAVSVIENLLRQCENGAGMSDFVYEPQVIDSKVVAKDDFVLWYPFE